MTGGGKGSSKTRLGFTENFLISGCSAAISKTSAAPIERVKLLLQNQGELLKQGRLDRSYTGVGDCVKRTLSNEGVLAFWRGNFASVVRYFPQQALNFAFKDEIQKKFKVGKNASKKERFSKNILSGGCAGSLSLVFVQSIDYTRTRLGVDAKRSGGERQFSGIMDVYVKTIKADGLLGLYRGFGISCTCIFIYRGLYFGLFDSLKPLVLTDSSTWLTTFLLGWAVTVTSGVCAYPLDSVKRRMMMTAGEEVRYSSSMACFREIVAREGYRALFRKRDRNDSERYRGEHRQRGAGVNIVRGVAGAGVLTSFDRVKAFYISKKQLM